MTHDRPIPTYRCWQGTESTRRPRPLRQRSADGVRTAAGPLTACRASRLARGTHQGRTEPAPTMSKSNVNPNHYKAAGRERQGEDIAQARNKQKHAKSVVRQRTEFGARSRTLAAQETASPSVAPTRPTKTGPQKARVTAVQTSPRQKHGRNLVPGKRMKRSRAAKRTVSRSGIGVTPAAGAGVRVLDKKLPRRRPEPRT